MSDMDTSGRQLRKKWPEALKREIVEATLQPGASVSIVARRYDVNANQVFDWRRRYGKQPPAPAAALVPVTIVAASNDVTRTSAPVPPVAKTIEIEIGGDLRVRVGPHFDGCALKRVLDVLRKR